MTITYDAKGKIVTSKRVFNALTEGIEKRWGVLEQTRAYFFPDWPVPK